jgi:hypothetical protein
MDDANEVQSDQIDDTIATRNVMQENEEIKRDEMESNKTEVPRPPIAPALPVVAGKLLQGLPLDFIDFLHEEQCTAYCALLFPEGTSGATMLSEFQKGVEFNYFGPRTSCTPWNAGKLDRLNSATKRLLAEFAERAYQGDSEGRHINYWKAIAKLVWQALAGLNAQRERAEKIKKREIERQQGLPTKRAAAAERAKRYRARRTKFTLGGAREEQRVACTPSSEAILKLEGGR